LVEPSATGVGDLMKFALDSLLSTVVNLEELMPRETMREVTTLKAPALEETVGEQSSAVLIEDMLV
jgi:hypothetical protein